METNKKIPVVKAYQYTILLIRPIILGIIGAVIWYFLRQRISVVYEDQGVFEPLLGLIVVAHGFLATMQIQKVDIQHQKIKEAIRRKDKELFEENACIRISPVIKFLLAIFSIVFFVIFLIYPFHSIYTGVMVVWITMFALYLLWEVAAELDDPFHGIWKIDYEKIKEIFNEK